MEAMKSILVLLLIFFLMGFWGCSDDEPDKIEITQEKEALQVEEKVALKAVDLSDKGDGMPDQESQQDPDNDIKKSDQSGLPVAEKAVQPGSKMPGLSDDAPPEVIEIYSSAFEEYKKGPVKLSHLKHFAEYNVACIDCHHDYQDGKNVWIPTAPVESCASCHDPKETKGDVKKLQTAYHTNCKNCHKEMLEEGKSEDAPYKKCADCHEDKD
ncbi:cytochrome c3 family protein [Thermodesulfobacteriota bacterium]